MAFVERGAHSWWAILPVFDEGIEELAEWLKDGFFEQRVLGFKMSEQDWLGDPGTFGDFLGADLDAAFRGKQFAGRPRGGAVGPGYEPMSGVRDLLAGIERTSLLRGGLWSVV
jgi:hypothetical protein